VFNDAVIIILYQTVIAAANAKDITPFQNALYSVAGFVYLFFVSFMLGAMFGLFTAYLLKLTREKAMEEKIEGEQLLHVLIMLTSPIISYLVAQVIFMYELRLLNYQELLVCLLMDWYFHSMEQEIYTTSQNKW